MKIVAPKEAFITRAQAITELEALLRAVEQPLEQPCPNCAQPDMVGQPESCHWQCSGAAEGLSSEPATHPIEPHVIEITFELSKLGLFQPCWSCEGHLDQLGNIYRLPQINFYCAKPVYAALLNEHVALLHHSDRLHTRWHVGLGNLGQVLGVVYALEPVAEECPSVPLEALHEDLHTIGNRLAEKLRMVSEARLASLKMEQATQAAFHCQRL